MKGIKHGRNTFKDYISIFFIIFIFSSSFQINASTVNTIIELNTENTKITKGHEHAISIPVISIPVVAIEEQRRLFEDGLVLARNGKVEQLNQIQKKLINYPLVDYLEATLIQYHPEKYNSNALADFLEQHKDYPFYSSLRQQWLKNLARQKQWSVFEHHLQNSDHVELQCLNLHQQQTSLHKIDQQQDAESQSEQTAWNQQAKLIWLTAKSLPKSCDPVLSHWQKNNQLTTELVWQRLNLALEAGEFKFARYLQNLLPKSQQKLASKLTRYWKRPSRYPESIKALYDDNYVSLENLQSVVNHFIWANPTLALENWFKDPQWLVVSSPNWYRSMALSLATQKHPQAIIWLSNLPEAVQDDTTRHWRLSTLLSQGDWPSVENLLIEYTQKWPEDLGYQFWLAQAYASLNKTPLADLILTDLAGKRHYYGFLAAKQLNQPPQLNHKKSEIDENLFAHFKDRPRFKRAKEFYLLNKAIEARREWRGLISDIDESEVIIAANIAQELGWNDRAIMMLTNSEHSDEIEIRFPMPFLDEFKNSASQFDIPLSYSLAIARQESAFQVDASSGKGARGLMQLLPSTAKSFSKQFKLNYHGKESLYKPEVNLLIGTAYLTKLYHRNEENFIYASAAYNAGEKALKKWKESGKNLSPNIWIEAIPYAETRNYVKQVFSFELIYDQLLKQKVMTTDVAMLNQKNIRSFQSELSVNAK